MSTLRMLTHLSFDLLNNHATSLPYMYIRKYWLRCVNEIKIQFGILLKMSLFCLLDN